MAHLTARPGVVSSTGATFREFLIVYFDDASGDAITARRDMDGNVIWSSTDTLSKNLLAIDEARQIYITNGTEGGTNEDVHQRFTNDNSLDWNWVNSDNTPPTGAAIDQNGNVYACFGVEARVVKFDSNGNESWDLDTTSLGGDWQFSNTGKIHITFDDGVIVYGGNNDTLIGKLDSDGNSQWTFTGTNGSNEIQDFTVQRNGTLYYGYWVGSTDQRVIKSKVDNGASVGANSTWSNYTIALDGYSSVWMQLIECTDSFVIVSFIADSNDNRIQKLDLTGSLVWEHTITTAHNGEIDGLQIDENDIVYVMWDDSANDQTVVRALSPTTGTTLKETTIAATSPNNFIVPPGQHSAGLR